MREAIEIDVLARILQIRRAQQAAGEAALRGAAGRRNRLHDEHQNCHRQLIAYEIAWARAVSESLNEPGVVGAWSAVVGDHLVKMADIEADLEQASAEKERACNALRAAIARTEMIKETLSARRRRLQRRADDAREERFRESARGEGASHEN